MRAIVHLPRAKLFLVAAVIVILGLLPASEAASGSTGATAVPSPAAVSGAAAVSAAARVNGRQVRIVVKGQRYGKRARVTLKGYRGTARGVNRTVRVKNTRLVKRLVPGRYKIIAKRIRANGAVAKATRIQPKLIRVANRRGARTRISYRQTRQATLALALATQADPTVHTVTSADLGNSWRSDCPVAPRQLRALDINFIHYSGNIKRGRVIVAAEAVDTTRAALVAAFRSGFRFESMIPVQAFDSSDDRSMRADNTSAFRCVTAERSGGRYWSAHALGTAIDINPRRNPDVFPNKVLPGNGLEYATRWPVQMGMLTPESAVSKVFRTAGWTWGGDWRSHQDYQHFSLTGN